MIQKKSKGVRGKSQHKSKKKLHISLLNKQSESKNKILIYSIKKIENKKPKEKLGKRIWKLIKNILWVFLILIILLISFLDPILQLQIEWNNVIKNWKLISPNPKSTYQVRPQTLKETYSVHHHKSGKVGYSYTEYFISFESLAPNFKILNTGVLEKNYHQLENGQTVYTIVEIKSSGQEKILYADVNQDDTEKVLKTYLHN